MLTMFVVVSCVVIVIVVVAIKLQSIIQGGAQKSEP